MSDMQRIGQDVGYRFFTGNQRKTIAVLAGSLSSPFQEGIFLGACDACESLDYNVLVLAGGPFNHKNPRDKIFDIINLDTISGVIIPMSSHSRFISGEQAIAFMERFAAIPTVNLNGVVPGITSVLIDYDTGFSEAIRHLVQVHGKRNIALLRGPENHQSSNEREAIFRRVLQECGLEADDRLVVQVDLSRSQSARAVQELLDLRSMLPDAIATINDLLALGIIDELNRRAIRVPQDMPVIGSMDIHEGSFATPSLTTVSESMYELGFTAVQILHRMIEGQSVPARVLVPTRLVIRKSCGCSRLHEPVLTMTQETHAVQPFAVLMQEFGGRLRASVHAMLAESMHGYLRPEDEQWVASIILAVEAVFKGASPDTLYDCIAALFEQSFRSERIVVWLRCLGMMRQHLLLLCPLSGDQHIMSSLWSGIDVLKEEYEAKALQFLDFEVGQYINVFRDINIRLNFAFDLVGVSDLVTRVLHISDCFIATFGRQKELPARAHCLMAIRNGVPMELSGDDKYFYSKDLFPRGTRPFTERFSLLVTPLFFRDDLLGFMTFSVSVRKGNIYENFLSQMGVALNNALQITTIQEAEERFSDIAHSTSDWLWEVDEHSRFTYCSEGVVNVLGYSAGEMLLHGLFDFVQKDEFEYLALVRDRLIPRREAINNVENWNVHKSGTPIGLLISGKPIFKDGVFHGYRGIYKDITEAKKQEEKIRMLAYYDVLTGLPNRALFADRLEMAMNASRRAKTGFALMFLDLDRFKVINDTLGHDAGDELLQSVATRLKSCLRQTDTLCRLGGDEFTIIVDSFKATYINGFVKRLFELLAAPVTLKDHQIHVSCSIGIALFPGDGQDMQSLLKNADKAMYRAKEAGKNRYVFYDDDAENKNSRRMEMEATLYQALREGHFLLQYQPQVDPETGRLCAVEALVRLRGEGDRIILPSDFIPLAEEIGLIEAIGEWVFRTAAKRVQSWQRPGHKPVKVAVNVSARQFRNPHLWETLAAILKDEGTDPSLVEIEITENTVMEDEETSLMNLGAFKKLGMDIALDDFGTGYSSLGSLKKFPIDTVKLDRSFVIDSTTSPQSAAIIKAIVIMTKALNLRTVAEGVETRAQRAFIREQGCDLIQGYYFSTPLDAAEIDRIISDDRSLDPEASVAAGHNDVVDVTNGTT